MSLLAAVTSDDNITFKKENRWKEVWRRLRKDHVAMFGFFVISAMIILTLIADFIVPYDYPKTKKNETYNYNRAKAAFVTSDSRGGVLKRRTAELNLFFYGTYNMKPYG